MQNLAEGKFVSLTTAAQEMTTQEAANFLGVSRQFLVRLLDDGKAGLSADLTSFRTERDAGRHDAIKQMAREAVKDGVYDEF